MIRQRLEELSLEALLQVAVRNEVDPDPDIDRHELIDQLVEVITENRLEREAATNAPGRVEQKKFILHFDDESPRDQDFSDSIDFPDQYSHTRITLMLRDPHWAFAYWDISAGKKSEYERSERFDGLFLRVLELEDDQEEELQINDSFEIPVQLSDRSWYMYLPRQDAPYRIQLIGKNLHRRELLAVSNRVRSPRTTLPIPPGGADERQKQILDLCGLEYLEIRLPSVDAATGTGN